MLLSGCGTNPSTPAHSLSTNEASQSETTGEAPFIQAEEVIQQDYTAEELEQIKLNKDQTVTESMNIKGRYPSRMLYVKDTDTFFYSQYNKFYQWNGDKLIQLLDTAALSLSLYEGKLYYILPVDRDLRSTQKRWGILCCLDLSTGEITQVAEERIVIYAFAFEGDIYYALAEKHPYGEITVAVTTYKLNLKTGEKIKLIEHMHNDPFALSKKYTVFADYTDIESLGTEEASGTSVGKVEFTITNRETGEVKKYTDDGWIEQLSIYGDDLYYINGSVLIKLDLVNLNETVYRAENPYGDETTYIGVYTIHNGKIIVSSGSDVSFWNEEDNKWETFIPLTDESIRGGMLGFDDFVSDGECLYGQSLGNEWLKIEFMDMQLDLTLPDGSKPDGEMKVSKLSVLSLDSSFDLCMLSSKEEVSGNLRSKGTFYPLNDIPGIHEYLDRCFPYVKETAIAENGEIWMLPIALNIDMIMYNEASCAELGTDFSAPLTPEKYRENIDIAYSSEKTLGYDSHAYLINTDFIMQLLRNDSGFDTPDFRSAAELLKSDFNYVKGNERFRPINSAISYTLEDQGFGNPEDFLFSMRDYSMDQMFYSDGINMRISPMPSVTNDSRSIAVCTYLCVNPASKNLEAACDYIESLVQHLGGDNSSVLFSDTFAQDNAARKDLYGIYSNASIEFNISFEIFRIDYERYLADEITLDEFIAEAERKLKVYQNE